MLFFFLIIACIILWYVVETSRYKKTDYYKTTHKSFGTVRFDKGNYGEYLTYIYLRKYEEDGAKFLYNCYLPKDKGETTEIDVMMIHQSGIYVFESKNYSGWIFGSEYQKTWTQTLPSGRKSHKEHFLNPIMQNKLHIKWLENQIGESVPIHSVIVFSERCTLKKIDLNSSNIYVIKRDAVKQTVADIAGRMGVSISQAQVEDIYRKLYPFTQVMNDVKQKHIQNIYNNHKDDITTPVDSNNVTVPLEDNLVCPKCDGKLVLRTAKRGTYAGSQFYGCSNFPKCKYMKNIQ
jgi:hypothetical protein